MKSGSVIPAWRAGIQVRMDATGDIRVGLDSSSPCWNDALAASASIQQRLSGCIFKRDTEYAEE